MKAEQVVIAPGMREDIDPRHLPIGTPRLLQNVRVRQGARFEHRPGQQNLGVSGLAATNAIGGNACWVAEHQGMSAVGIERVSSATQASRRSYVYLQDAAGTWQVYARHGVVVPERRVGIVTDQDFQTPFNYSCVAANDIIYVAYERSDNVAYLLVVDVNGTVLNQKQLTGTRPRVLYINSQLILVTQVSTTLRAHQIAESSLTTIASNNFGTLATSTADWDIAPVVGDTTWIAAYADGGTSITFHRMSGVTSAASNTLATTSQATLIGVAAEGTAFCAGYADGTDIEQFIGAVSTLLGTNNTVRAAAAGETYRHQVGVASMGSGTFGLVMGGDQSTSAPVLNSAFLAHTHVTSSGNVFTPQKVPNLQPASKPFTYGASGERQLLILAHNHNSDSQWASQSAHFIVELPRVDANGAANLCAISYEHIATYSDRNVLTEVCDIGNGRRATLALWKDPTEYCGLDLMVFRSSLASESMLWANRQVLSRGGMYISGGCLYDIAEPVVRSSSTDQDTIRYGAENGFPWAPEIAGSIASGGSMATGVSYSLVAVYRSVDATGRVHRSAPSEPITVTPTGFHRRILGRVATVSASGRSGQNAGGAGYPVADIYRSWNGGPYYFDTDSDAVIDGSELEVDWIAGQTDSNVEDNHTLYTDLGILPTMPPSGARLICQSGSRMFTVGWRPNVAQFSKLYIPTAPWEFVDDDSFRLFFPEDLTAIYYLDGAFVAWSARNVYVVTGDGPNDQGVGSFSDPRPLPVTCGADSPHVVETPAGLMYYGAGTIWLLPRGFGAPVPVGDAIQKTIAAYPYLRGAVRCANDDYDLTHFLLAAGDTTTSATVVAVWDNKLNAWSRDQLSCDIGAIGAVDGVLNVLLATWSALSAKPVRKLQDAVSDLNNSGTEVWNEMRVGFGDFRPYGPHGWGRLDRFQVHGEVDGLCDMNVVSVVEGTTGMNARGVTALATKHMTGVGQFYAENAIAYPPGGAFGFEIYDSGLGAGSTHMTSGLVLHSVAFAPGEPQGLRKLSDQERF